MAKRGFGTEKAFGSIALQAFWISAQATLQKLPLQKASRAIPLCRKLVWLATDIG